MAGEYEGNNGWHAVCAVGFRQAASTVAVGSVELEDTKTEFVYLHDDNLGPAARFTVEVDPGDGHVALRADPPPRQHSLTLTDPTVTYHRFIPTALLAAAHSDVRVTPDRLHDLALRLATALVSATGGTMGLIASSRVVRLSEYVGVELQRLLGAAPDLLSRTRLALWETVAPMSLHLGVVRVGTSGAPLLDVLYDTTDSVPNMRAFCHVAFDANVAGLVEHLHSLNLLSPGVRVAAY